LVLLVLALPAPASAAREQVIAVRGAGAQLAVDEAGRAFLVSPSARRDVRPLPWVRLRAAAPHAGFGRPRTLVRSRRGDHAVDAGVAADGRGVVVLQSVRGGRRRVRVVAFGPAPAVGRPVAVSRGRGSADFAASAVARGGAAVVTWFRHRSNRRWRLEAAIREPGARAFGRPVALSAFARRSCCTAVSVGIGANGAVVAAWSSTSRPGAWVALRGPGRGFRAPERVAVDATAVPRVVVGANGTAAVLYGVQHVPRRPADGPQLRRVASGGPLGAAEPVDPSCRASTAEAAVTPAGRVLVACVDEPAASRSARVRVFEAGPGELLQASGDLGAHVVPRSLAVAADDHGRAVVAWAQRIAGGPQRAVAAMRGGRGAPFGAPVALGRPWTAADPLLGRLVRGGGALVVWRGSRPGGAARRRAAIAVTRLP
jgi:hypothetical protein